MSHTATYSPEDNKLRIYPAHRLDAATYARVKAAGYSWGGKTEAFIAPAWTPEREDIALELCGEIGDEDKSLAERAEERAERFDGYQENRAADAHASHAAVRAIADNIPMGQPILVGHHSARHARRDAERIENGMRRAVNMWETALYWKRRAAAALAHAQFKERPDVRARRIKGLEADQRKIAQRVDRNRAALKLWSGVLDDEASTLRRKDGATSTARDRALYLAGIDHVSACFPLAQYPREAPASQYEGTMSLYSALEGGVCTVEQAREIAMRVHARAIAHDDRWLAHLANRLEYERAMLEESGGIKAAQWDLQPGGTITHRARRSVILRVNRKDGAPVSVSVTGQSWTVGLEEITDYAPPSEAAAAAVKRATTLAPLVNYERPGAARMTAAEYAEVYKDYKGTETIKATEETGAHRVRVVSSVNARRHGGTPPNQWGFWPVFIVDAKVTPAPPLNPPPKTPRRSMARHIAQAEGIDTSDADTPPSAPIEKAEGAPSAPIEEKAPTLRDVVAEVTAPRLSDVLAAEERAARRVAVAEDKIEAEPFEAMRQALRAGVQVVAAPQLFPTPAALAARMVDEAQLVDGMRVLEPSAGTGAILRAIAADGAALEAVHAVEIRHELAQALHARGGAVVHWCDFLAIDGPDAAPPAIGADPAPLGLFDRVIMNPPFANADDVRHVLHARRFLKPGGRLVAIVAGGPRQAAALEPIASHWEPLPEGTFAASGTSVRTVLCIIEG